MMNEEIFQIEKVTYLTTTMCLKQGLPLIWMMIRPTSWSQFAVSYISAIRVFWCRHVKKSSCATPMNWHRTFSGGSRFHWFKVRISHWLGPGWRSGVLSLTWSQPADRPVRCIKRCLCSLVEVDTSSNQFLRTDRYLSSWEKLLSTRPQLCASLDPHKYAHWPRPRQAIHKMLRTS